MDIDKIEQSYTQFRDTAQQAFQLIDGLIGKMQDASQNGDSQAGEWAQELKDIASTFQNGQGHAGDLVQQLVGIVGALGGKSGNEKGNESGSGSEGGSAGNAISNLLNSELGKSLGQGALQKIGTNLLGRLFR